MSEKEINKYRLTSLEEPTDEMLSFIMREAAEEASALWKKTEQLFFDQLKKMAEQSSLAAL